MLEQIGYITKYSMSYLPHYVKCVITKMNLFNGHLADNNLLIDFCVKTVFDAYLNSD